MIYQPSFVEVFVGAAVCVLWSHALVARGGLPVFSYTTPVMGLTLLGSQVLGVIVAFGASGAVEPWRMTLLSVARWGSVSVVLAGLVLLLAGSVALSLKKRT